MSTTAPTRDCAGFLPLPFPFARRCREVTVAQEEEEDEDGPYVDIHQGRDAETARRGLAGLQGLEPDGPNGRAEVEVPVRF